MSEKEDRALERAVVGALRSAIHDHGAITPEKIGSAAKRVVGNLKNAPAAPDATSAAAATLGRKGGRAGTGKSKRRPSSHYSKASAKRWANMTKAERSAEMSRRRRKGVRAAKAKERGE